MTAPPSAAIRRAVASPMLLAPPVTTQTLSLKRVIRVLLLRLELLKLRDVIS